MKEPTTAMRPTTRIILAAALAAVTATAQGAAVASSPDRSDQPLPTGRVLVSVAAPAPPTGDSRAARELRATRRARSRELLDAVSALPC